MYGEFSIRHDFENILWSSSKPSSHIFLPIPLETASFFQDFQGVTFTISKLGKKNLIKMQRIYIEKLPFFQRTN